MFSQRFKTTATQGNQNNEIGVPATILAADEDTEVLIVELGMRGMHQIEHLCTFVKPSIAVVTNVGVSHMELLGSRENIAHAKSERSRLYRTRDMRSSTPTMNIRPCSRASRISRNAA